MLGVTTISVNYLNVKATPPTYHHYQLVFPTNDVMRECPPLYCLENDSLGIYIYSTDIYFEDNFVVLLNRTNRDKWLDGQSYSSILTLYAPEEYGFNEVIIPEDGYYFLGGWTYSTFGSFIEFDIIHVHSSIAQCTNNTYYIYDTEDPEDSEGRSVSFGWGFVMVAGVVVVVLYFKTRKTHFN